jgi:hypothetical protein
MLRRFCSRSGTAQDRLRRRRGFITILFIHRGTRNSSDSNFKPNSSPSPKRFSPASARSTKTPMSQSGRSSVITPTCGRMFHNDSFRTPQSSCRNRDMDDSGIESLGEHFCIYSLKGNSRQFLVTLFPEKVPGICGIFEKFRSFSSNFLKNRREFPCREFPFRLYLKVTSATCLQKQADGQVFLFLSSKSRQISLDRLFFRLFSDRKAEWG